VGRKFLVAGRGGLNLTHMEPRDQFAGRFRGPDQPAELWGELLAGFDADAMRHWASALGVETFAATSGRVYPRELKAAPLLRRWVHRLRIAGVKFVLRHRWSGLRPGTRWQMDFKAGPDLRTAEADAVILALGGGSWPQTGSDGGWVSVLDALGVAVAPLAPANCGWEVGWSPAVLASAEGRPLKNLTAQVPEILIDFKPAHTVEQLVRKLGTCRRNFFAEARSRWRLCDATVAVLEHWAGSAAFASSEASARAVKGCRVQLRGPRPLAEAISSAGGVRWSELDSSLMVRRLPGVFVAGEMIDWEAPTGGYLIQGCFATGTRAARGALDWLRTRGG
jgi:predicted flavoprotein YhiN